MRPAILLGLLLSACGATSARAADQSEELRQKATVIKTEAVRLAEAGQRGEASRLATIADDLMSLADRSDPEPRRGTVSGPTRVLASLRALLQDRQKVLHDYERRMRNPNGDHAVRKLRDEIFELKREITRVERDAQNAGQIEEAASRILHLRVAADHLQQAGMLDLAGRALLKAGVLDQELLEVQRRLKSKDQTPPPPQEVPKNVEAEELRKEMEAMRAELEDLRKQAKAK